MTLNSLRQVRAEDLRDLDIDTVVMPLMHLPPRPQGLEAWDRALRTRTAGVAVP